MIRAAAYDSLGQATVEYLLIGIVLITMVAGLAALWRYTSGERSAEQSNASASHVVEGVEGVADVLAY